jgi:hypothetical protein
MKAVLEFNLPEDDHEFEMATSGSKFHSVLWDMDQYLRSKIKYAPDDMSDDTLNTLEQCRSQLHEFMGSYNVSFD